MGRAELLALGRAARSWEFVPLAIAALGVAPGDADVRLLLATCYARLGLVTPARQALASLDANAAKHPNVALIRSLMAQLPDDRLGLERRVALARANVSALARRDASSAGALLGRLDVWINAASDMEVFCARDGNVVMRRAGAGVEEGWTLFADQRSHLAADLAACTRANSVAQIRTIYIEGLCPPWVLGHLAERAGRNTDGSWQRLVIVEPDLDAALTGLSLCDLTGALSQERTTVMVGPDGIDALRRWLDARLEQQIAGPVVAVSGPCGSVGREIDAALARQTHAMEAAVAAADKAYRSADRGHWAVRFGGAMAGAGAPLRVLIPTTRFSTFLKHSAQDLAHALARAGCEARLLIEPDDSSVLCGGAYAAEIARFKPDLLVVLNYPRSHLGRHVPAGLPCVMFVQDAMPHLFSTHVGRSLGPFDFVMGHLYGQWFKEFDYPAARTLQCPVLVSGEKFHDGPVGDQRRLLHTCEIAYVSHQSETPRACRDRLIAESRSGPGGGGAIPAIIEAAYPRLEEMASDALRRWHVPTLTELASSLVSQATGRPADGAATMLVLNSVIKVLGDRLIRHQAVQWAADVCRRRGWRLALYGRGWERHPTLSGFARGELEHGEDLRASYHCAAVHLHASSSANLHQRVMECALSGGLPAARLKHEDVTTLTGYTQIAVAARIERQPDLDPGPNAEAPLIDHWEALAQGAMMQRVGLDAPPTVWINRGFRTRPWHMWGDEPMPYQAAWLLGDWAESTFWDEPSLEALVERAIERPQWRRELSLGIAARARRFTYDRLARDLLRLVAGSMAGVGAAS